MVRLIAAFLLILSSNIFVIAQDNKPVIYIPYDVGNQKLKIIDAMSLAEIDSIPLPGLEPMTVVLRPDRKLAFISSDPLFGNGIHVLDLSTRVLIKKILDGKLISGLKIGPDGRLYALIQNTAEVVAINSQTFSVEQTVKIGAPPASISFSIDGNDAYVLTGLLDNQMFNELVKINLTSFSVTNSKSGLPDGTVGGNEALALSPDGNFIYIARDRQVLVADTTTLEIVSMLPGAPHTGNLQLTPDGKTLYALEYTRGGQSFLDVIDIPTKSAKQLTLGGRCRFMKLSSDGRLLYVNSLTFFLDIIDTKTNTIIAQRQHIENGLGEDLVLAGDFNAGIPPNVNIIAPLDNEVVQKGKLFTFKWQSSPGTSNLSNQLLEISLDGGVSFIPLGGKLNPDIQQFDFQAPITRNDNVQFRISITDVFARTDTKLVRFSFDDKSPDPGDTQPPSVNFIRPNGNERFNSGDIINITWASSDNIGVTTQDLALSTDGGSTFPIVIAAGLPGAVQSFNYQLPTDLLTNAGRLRLVVRDAAGLPAQAVTASNFQIQNPPPVDTQAPTITFSSPSPSANIFSAGQAITVNWMSVDNIGVISQELLLSFDGGATFQTIASFDGQISTFTLNNLPELDKTTNSAVKIIAKDAKGNSGEMIATFITAPALVMADYAKPILSVSGIGLTAEGQTDLKVLINDIEVPTARITSSNNTKLVLKGNKKKLNVKKGFNTLKVVVNGIISNTTNFNF